MPSSIREGNETTAKCAIEKMFREHRERFLAYARGRSSSKISGRRDPEDVLQIVYVKALSRWKELSRLTKSIESWFFCILRSCLFDDHAYQSYLCRDYHIEVSWPDRSSSQFAMGIESAAPSPSKVAYSRDLQIRVHKVLKQLSAEHQEIIMLVHFEEMSQSEAATILGISQEAARQRYTRARSKLREIWKMNYPNEEFGNEPTQ